MARLIKNRKAFSAGMILVAIGIVYGDIATSPMYVMKSIIAGNGGINQVDKDFIIGSLSLVIWTVTLLTTVKHVLIAMKADNHGEGGIFALYSLVKRCWKWLVLPAMIGGATLLADSILTPAVTVTTAVEGLRSIPVVNTLLGPDQAIIILIVLTILLILFSAQRAGTSIIGKTFGPFMMVWFLFLAFVGISCMRLDLDVLRALNPMHALAVLVSPNNKAGFMILGSVFLATTGAEALYSDMGHVGKKSIYISWPFVKLCLILNYMGQGAWIIANSSDTSLASIEDLNPFYMMMDPSIRFVGIILGAIAAIIASQALITGSFSIVSEAIRLNLLPQMQTFYPAETKGQLYIPLVNWVLWAGCSIVVLLFQTSAHMESAYGLAITITLLMVTILLTAYLWCIRRRKVFAVIFALIFAPLELVFFLSCIGKFAHGGWFALLVAFIIYIIMVSWLRGSEIEAKQRHNVHLKDYLGRLDDLRQDKMIPKCANNLVYLNHVHRKDIVDRDALYSILDNESKRADTYWFVNFVVTSRPHGCAYKVDTYGTDFVYRVVIKLGYKEEQRVNVYLDSIIHDLIDSGEFKLRIPEHTVFDTSNMKKYHKDIATYIGNFKYCMVLKTLSPESDIDNWDKFFLATKYRMRKIVGTPDRWYGLENSSVIRESVPLYIKRKTNKLPLKRLE